MCIGKLQVSIIGMYELVGVLLENEHLLPFYERVGGSRLSIILK